MFIPALHTLQTSSPHGIEESLDVLFGMAEFDSESESGLSYSGAQRRNDKIWK